MRIAFATTSLSLPRDLVDGYANVEVTAVWTSYRDVADGMAAGAGDPRDVIDVLLLSDGLSSAEDRATEWTLERAIARVRELRPATRLIILSRKAEDEDLVAKLGVERFIEVDPRSSAINLAALLKIPAKTEIAKIIAITGHQGGAGRTTIAQAVSDGLSEYVAKNTARGGVLLWELDLEHPTIGFDQEVDVISADHGRKTIARLLNQAPVKGDEDLPTIRESIISRDRSRLPYDLLLAPHGIREVMAHYQAYPSVRDLRERLEAILTVLSRHYQAIVVDLPTNLVTDPAAAVVLPVASHILAVATPSPAGLRSVMTMRALVSDLHLEARARLVLNRVRRDDGLYVRYCQAQAQGVLEVLKTISDGASPSEFTSLGPKLIGLER